MQTKSDLEKWYNGADPWNYESTQDDQIRKEKILAHCMPCERALDIGAGEGFITRDLPSKEIFAYEISDKASERLPDNVTRVTELDGLYDLIIATGVFYKQYDWQAMHHLINQHAGGRVVTSNIKSWEIPLEGLTQIHEEEFPYREYTQKLRVYEIDS